MIRKILLPLLSIVGVVLAIYTVNASNQVLPPAPPVAPPAQASFDSKVAGAGLIEASTQNLAIGTVVPGIVTKVSVEVGDRIEAGRELFRIDDREQQSQLRVAEAALYLANEQLNRLSNTPRAEDVPPLEAAVRAAQASRDNAQREVDRMARVGFSASRDEIDRARFQLDASIAQFEQAQAELARLKAGAWDADLEVAKAQVAQVQAQVNAAKVEIDRRIVKSPITGTVLQVNIRAGEFAQVGPLQTPLMLVGDTDTLHIRVDIDENDAWRVVPDALAQAFIRGNSRLSTNLKFVRIEPYVVPKRNLTGQSSERVDTRVLQVLYAFDRAEFEKSNQGVRVYAGQQMDVFIDAPGVESAAKPTE